MPHKQITRLGTGKPVYFVGGYMVFRIGGQQKYAHRHVMELLLGRALNTNEHVHHKDGDRLNNFPDNLELLSAGDHAKEHMTYERAKRLSVLGHRARWGTGV